MILEGLHEKKIFDTAIPLRIAENTSEYFDYPLHWHNAVELLYSAASCSSVVINNEKYDLHSGDIMTIGSGDIHSFHTKANTGTTYFIQFDPMRLSSFWGPKQGQFQPISTQYIPANNSQLHYKLEEHILELIKEFKAEKASFELFLNARLLDITVLLIRNFSINYEASSGKGSLYDLSKLDKAFEYIEKNYQRPLTLKEAAASTGFSSSYFSREFKKSMDKNFHTFLNEYRIRKAESFLTDETKSITEIAYSSGFNSLVTFNRIFKQVKGCTPSEYIKICY